MVSQDHPGHSPLLFLHTHPDPLPAKPTIPMPRAAHSQALGPSPSNAVRVPPVMSLAATSRTPWASPGPVQHHHTGDKVDHLPRAQHKQIRAGVTTPVPVTGVGIMVKERVRSRAPRGKGEEDRALAVAAPLAEDGSGGFRGLTLLADPGGARGGDIPGWEGWFPWDWKGQDTPSQG